LSEIDRPPLLRGSRVGSGAPDRRSDGQASFYMSVSSSSGLGRDSSTHGFDAPRRGATVLAARVSVTARATVADPIDS
ncbi:MAG: hypothetical protein ACERNK_14895, partial [Deltaproteobacteria bacterium]